MRDKVILLRIEQLIEQATTYESFFMDNPIPSWHKKIVSGDRLVMDRVNPAYTAVTGISVEAYKGQEDARMWGNVVGENFGENDRTVIRNRAPIIIEEPAKNPITGKPQVWVGWKWPRFDSEGEVIGIWGQAIAYDAEVWQVIRNSHPAFNSDINGGSYE